MYDRAEKNFEVGYDEEARQKGMAARQKLDPKNHVHDYMAAQAYVKDSGKVAIMGYCYGGTVAWQGAQTGGFDASVGSMSSNATSIIPASICAAADGTSSTSAITSPRTARTMPGVSSPS